MPARVDAPRLERGFLLTRRQKRSCSYLLPEGEGRGEGGQEMQRLVFYLLAFSQGKKGLTYKRVRYG